MSDIVGRLLTFDGLAKYLSQPFVHNALIAAAVLGLIAGLLAPLIVARGMAFAVHGTAELAFTGGAAGLLVGTAYVGFGAVRHHGDSTGRPRYGVTTRSTPASYIPFQSCHHAGVQP